MHSLNNGIQKLGIGEVDEKLLQKAQGLRNLNVYSLHPVLKEKLRHPLLQQSFYGEELTVHTTSRVTLTITTKNVFRDRVALMASNSWAYATFFLTSRIAVTYHTLALIY